MSRVSRLFAVLVLVLAAAAAAPPAALADAGAVHVTVYEPKPDRTREPLVGATVFLSDANKQHPDQAQLTDENGHALFPLVAPGAAYDVSVSLAGHMKVTKKSVRVVASVTTQVTIGLLPEMITEFTVTGRAKMVDLDVGAQGATTITGEEFKDLPVMGRDYQNILTLAPGVQDTNHDGNPNIHGAREGDFRLTVDGVSNVDPLTGMRMSDVNPDAIEEIQVVDSGADASFGGAVGGFGKIVTKSGSNKFEGSLNLFLRDSMFDFDGAGAVDPVSFRSRQPSLYLSGPVVRDKMWFAVNHELIHTATPTTVVGGPTFVRILDSTRSADKLTWQVTPKNKLQLEWRSAPQKIAPDGVSRLVPEDSSFISKSGGPTTSLKWTAAFSPTFFWEATGAFSDEGQDTTPYNPNAINNCVSGEPGPANDRNNFPFFSRFYCVNGSTAGVASGPYYRVYHDKRQRWTYSLDAEQFIDRWLGGQHRIKVGLNVERATFERDDTVSPYLRLQQNASEDTISLGGGAALGTAFNLDATTYHFPGQGPPLTPLDRFNPQRGIDTAHGGYFGFYITDTYEPRANVNLTVGVRVSREELTALGYTPFDPQAEWNAYKPLVGPDAEACIEEGRGDARLCIDRAIRAHFPLFTMHPLDNETNDPRGCDAEINPTLCRQIKEIPASLRKVRSLDTINIASNGVAPRFSVAWDPRNDGKTKLSASWGRYYGDTPLAPLVLENGPDQVQSEYAITADHIIKMNDHGLPVSLTAVDTGFSVRMVDRNLRQQHSDEWSVALEREIAPEAAIRLRYVNRRYEDQLQDTDINHAPVTAQDAANRVVNPRFDKYTPACTTARGFVDCTGYYGVDYLQQNTWDRGFHPDGVPDLKIVDPFYNNVYLIGNFNRSTYYAYIVELIRRYYQNWEMHLSYTYSRTWGQAEDYGTSVGDDPTNTDDESGPLAYDQPHVFKVNGRVFVPQFGGLRIGGSVQYASGLPYSIVTPRSVVDFGADLSGCMPQSALPASEQGSCVGPAQFYNVPSFRVVYPTARTVYPTGHRNDQRNAAAWTVDVNVQKEIQFKALRTSLGLEIFNLLNDDTERTTQINREFRFAHLDSRTGVVTPITADTRVAQREFGRVFQISVRLNF